MYNQDSVFGNEGLVRYIKYCYSVSEQAVVGGVKETPWEEG